MKQYAKIIDDETKEVQIGVGCTDEYYREIGMTLMNVEQAYNGNWYVKGYAPVEPEPTHDDIEMSRRFAYESEVDCITAHIQRLRDEEQTPEIEAEIAELVAERAEKVAEIKERYPYPDNADDEVA